MQTQAFIKQKEEEKKRIVAEELEKQQAGKIKAKEAREKIIQKTITHQLVNYSKTFHRHVVQLMVGVNTRVVVAYVLVVLVTPQTTRHVPLRIVGTQVHATAHKVQLNTIHDIYIYTILETPYWKRLYHRYPTQPNYMRRSDAHECTVKNRCLL